VEYCTLGSSGLRVSRLCLGTLMFGAPWNTDHEDCIRTIHAALDAGMNFVDTGNRYSNGETEEIVGKALKGRRDQVVLVTKFGLPAAGGPNDHGSSRAHIMQEVERSLRRLGTDYIDVYQAHRPDPSTPIEETLRALDDLVRSGKVRYVGTSRFSSWQLVESLWVSDKRNLVSFVAEEPPYSVFQRDIETELLPMCERFGLGVTCFSPLNRGWLAVDEMRGGETGAAARIERGDAFNTAPESAEGQRKSAAVQELLPMAHEVGATLSQFALAWILANPVISAPIIGPLTREHLNDNLGAIEVRIPDEYFPRIDALCPPGSSL
jgi:aryl-alcohol dehydrogenase-like predicted oxidoreductase